jgi:hypothetical protein
MIGLRQVPRSRRRSSGESNLLAGIRHGVAEFHSRSEVETVIEGGRSEHPADVIDDLGQARDGQTSVAGVDTEGYRRHCDALDVVEGHGESGCDGPTLSLGTAGIKAVGPRGQRGVGDRCRRGRVSAEHSGVTI